MSNKNIQKMVFISASSNYVTLAKSTLKKSDFKFISLTVDTRELFVKAIEEFNPDIVIYCDSISEFNCKQALKLTLEYKTIPFIILGTPLAKNDIASIIKTGATGYVDEKQIEKLPEILNEVVSSRNNNKKFKNPDRLLAKIFEILPIGLWITDKNGNLLKGNPKGVEIWGAEPEVGPEDYGVFTARRLPSGEEIEPDDWALAHTINEGVTIEDELIEIDAFDGKTRTVLNYTAPVFGDEDELIGAIVVNQDVTDLKLVEKKLLDAKIAAEEANRSKSAFLANMSHELRTPLNSIIGFSQVLEDKKFGDLNEKQTRYVSNVLKSGNHLLAIINDILDISKVEAGEMDYCPEKIYVSECCNEMEALIQPLAIKKSINLKMNIEPKNMSFFADMKKTKQIIYNLISNAIKFTPENGNVDVTCKLIDKMCQISVSDNGIGISKKDQEKIFEPFKQVDSSNSRMFSGTGLGLTLTKQFAEMHGGTIKVESELGKGSTFIVTMPIDSNRQSDSSPNNADMTGKLKT